MGWIYATADEGDWDEGFPPACGLQGCSEGISTRVWNSGSSSSTSFTLTVIATWICSGFLGGVSRWKNGSNRGNEGVLVWLEE